MHVPLVRSYQQNSLRFLVGKYICQDTFASKAHRLHVYKHVLKSSYVYMVKETLQFASKNEQAAFQIDNVVWCYQEGQELKWFTVNYLYWPGMINSYETKLKKFVLLPYGAWSQNIELSISKNCLVLMLAWKKQVFKITTHLNRFNYHQCSISSD